MASKLVLGDDSNGDDGAAKPIHFFKIILPHNLSEGKLWIPKKFMRKYGEKLSNTMFLKLPNGAEWEVNLEKRDDEVWFQKGWKQFAEYHSLAPGHLVVFRYEGTTHFHVLICDKSALEIDYPFNKIDGKRASNGEELQPSKTRRTNGNERVERNLNLSEPAFPQTVKYSRGKLKKVSEGKRTTNQHTERSSFSNFGDREAAAKFNPENASFTVVIKLCHLKKWCVCLPRGSLKGYIKPGKQNVTLQVGERSWRVGLNHYPKYSSCYLVESWATFAREIGLQVGDACLFELLKNTSDDKVMKVTISKHSSVKL